MILDASLSPEAVSDDQGELRRIRTELARPQRPFSDIESVLWRLREPLRRYIHSRIGPSHRRAIDSEAVADSVILTYLRRLEDGEMTASDAADKILRDLLWLADGSWKGRRIGKLPREIRKSRRRGPVHGLDSVAAPGSGGTSGFDSPDPRMLDPQPAAVLELHAKVLEYVRTLPELYRQVFELMKERETRRTIATILEITPGQVGNVQRRLYKKIREHLGEQAFDVFGPSR
jgi:hypothetical protein